MTDYNKLFNSINGAHSYKYYHVKLILPVNKNLDNFFCRLETVSTGQYNNMYRNSHYIKLYELSSRYIRYCYE